MLYNLIIHNKWIPITLNVRSYLYQLYIQLSKNVTLLYLENISLFYFFKSMVILIIDISVSYFFENVF